MREGPAPRLCATSWSTAASPGEGVSLGAGRCLTCLYRLGHCELSQPTGRGGRAGEGERERERERSVCVCVCPGPIGNTKASRFSQESKGGGRQFLSVLADRNLINGRNRESVSPCDPFSKNPYEVLRHREGRNNTCVAVIQLKKSNIPITIGICPPSLFANPYLPSKGPTLLSAGLITPCQWPL